ncbi:MAG: DNA adenine methylase [Chloroflexota bacterium]
MIDFAPETFQYPSTRYSGSKRRLLGWLWEQIGHLDFDTVLDVFGGTASVSLMFKRYGKQVFYNDLLKFNQIIGSAIIENARVTVSDEDIESVLQFSQANCPDFIQREYSGIFFTDEENRWLDQAVASFSKVKDESKRAILMASLFQACLAKRPFNLFHRANLYLRTANVERTFCNKTTWDRPFPVLLRRYVAEYNRAVFSNGRDNKVIGGYDATSVPNGVDLVYLDPPYFSSASGTGTNYLAFYHFLEGLTDYENWAKKIDVSRGKTKRIADSREIQQFTRRSEISNSFNELLKRFKNNIIVLSYQAEGIPSRDEITSMLTDLGKEVKVHERPHRYVLSTTTKKELLFVAT